MKGIDNYFLNNYLIKLNERECMCLCVCVRERERERERERVNGRMDGWMDGWMAAYLSVCLFVCLSVCISVYLSVCISVCLSLSVYPCDYLYVFLFTNRLSFFVRPIFFFRNGVELEKASQLPVAEHALLNLM